MKFKFILVLIFMILSFCEAKGGGGRGGGGGRSFGSRGSNNRGTRTSWSKPRGFSSKNPNHFNTFGNGGLQSNSYIANNYYRTSGSSFLMHALFYQSMMHHGFGYGHGYHSHRRNDRTEREWDDNADKQWRATTRRPYFENKLPGSKLLLPAAAVSGAATAFGLVTLLPLNVPADHPLMYCSEALSDIAQAKIVLNGVVYECFNETILMTRTNCSEIDNVCQAEKNILQCDTDDKIHCIFTTLLSRVNLFCNSTTKLTEFEILNCYEGKLKSNKASFVPTLSEGVDDSLSVAAEIHLLLLKLIGKGDFIKRPDVWRPEAITMSPEELAKVPSTTIQPDY